MMLDNLYRQVIMYYSKNPANQGLVDSQDYKTVHLFNPSCGDDITMQIKLQDNILKDVRQQGKGCTICCSSASIATLQLIDKTLIEAEEQIEQFLTLIKGEQLTKDDLIKEAKAFQGVSQFPARVRCASISWKAVQQAIKEINNE